MLSHHRYVAFFPNPPWEKCRRLESKIRAVMLSVLHFPHLGSTSSGVAPHHVFASFCTRQSRPSLFFPRVDNLSIGTTNACCRFRKAPAAFTSADGKVAESARCCPLEPSRCFAMMFMESMKVYSPSLPLFVIESCSRVCLLVVSRLLGLTLRPFAPVCSCHWDSLTHGRLAIVQEAMRVFLFPVFSIGFCT